jgi:UDP-N-acetylmuramate--alanine ligase
MKDNIKKIHFIGIGGTGMSGLAQIYAQLGYTVTGSDLSVNKMTQKLSQMGVVIYRSHEAGNIGKADLVVVSSAIKENNPELVEARRINCEVWHRSRLLLDLMSTRQVIAVAGTHGKTTTSSMIYSMLLGAGLQPTAIIGGRVKEISSGATLGEGPWLVAEADESDGTFLTYSPRIAVINNIEADHLDYYKNNINNIIEAFRAFSEKVPADGKVIIGIDEPNAYKLAQSCTKPFLTFGLHPDSMVRAVNTVFENYQSVSDILYEKNIIGRLSLPMPGEHNLKNALASIAVGLTIGLGMEDMLPGLESFSGVDRRFQLLGEVNEIRVYDDYAHNPAKVAAAISGATTGGAKRVIAVFQPHRYTRTQACAEEFGKSFDRASLTILTSIYPAGEPAIPGVSTQLILDSAARHGNRNIQLISEREKINDYLMEIVKSGDLVLFMGAGDIWKIGEELVERLKNKYRKFKNPEKDINITGDVRVNVPLKKYTTLRVGGNADILAIAENPDDICRIVKYADSHQLPLFMLGAGSNILILDNGIRGIVLRMGRGMAYVNPLGNNRICCGGAIGLPQLARYCVSAGLSGLEPLAGIPASLGGAVFMNAGAHGRTLGELVDSVKAITITGQTREIPASEIEFGYHQTGIKDMIITEVTLKLVPDSGEVIQKRIEEFLSKRNATQPVNMPSAGCFFRNPQLDSAGRLIEMAGLKGLKIGDAMISPRHANFFVNTGQATAYDFLQLIMLTKAKVKEVFNINLDLEVRIAGEGPVPDGWKGAGMP